MILTVHDDMAYVASSAGSQVIDVRTGETVSSGDWAPVEMVWHAGAVTGFSPDEGGTLHFQKATDW
ncbi:hypothetical protein IEU95_13000 [Hoyosella rhizosphaerae]|uniref:hypothetical protein n=1 Tax=Hoyosella rhizosphaerae TaxID=1755582 RepID=UPI00166B5640|nr:hypothetical protein [Hoyosella rhizosphaerae]MBN4927755.1 hypothetical protein [Hoyosella rhizosphaerae]